MASPIDITVGGSEPPPDQPGAKSRSKRPFLGVKFLCADNAYARLYRNEAQTAYEGRCSRCLKQITIRIGAKGTDSRFFKYDCGRTS